MEVFRTGHPINERVCDSLERGFAGAPVAVTYGVLRGSGPWALSKPHYLIADNGYWKPGHFDGYYRLSAFGTQARFDPLHIERTRWHDLGIEVERWKEGSHILVCPPTEPVAEFFGLGMFGAEWGERVKANLLARGETREVVVRSKGNAVLLDEHMKNAHAVITFNSAVGWEALRRGLKVLSDSRYSTVGTWLAHHGISTLDDFAGKQESLDRDEIFSFMANRQFTLAEIEGGVAREWML